MSDKTPQKNRLARFLLSYSEADLGISAIILLVSTIGMAVAFIIFAAEQTRLLQLEFIHVGFHNPKFFEDIRGIAGLDEGLSYIKPTSNYVTYELMRQNIFPAGAVMVLVYVLVNAWGEAAGIFSKGTTKPMFLKFLGMATLVLVFVPVWDVTAVEVEKFSVSMLNPMYDRDTPDSCVGNPDRTLLLVAAQNQEIYQRLEESTLGFNDKGPCHPQLRIAYVYQKAFSGATNTLDNNEDMLSFDHLLANASNLGEIIGSTIFLGMTKTMMLFSLTLMGLVVMTIRELFLALLISLLPMFVLLAFVPKVGAIFARMLETILPLMLIPVITAAVFLTGAGILLDMEDEFAEVRSGGHERFTFWIASVSLLILATGIPLLMAPILSGVAGQASSMVSTAIVSGTLGAMSVIRGGLTGTAAGVKGVQDSGASLKSRAGLAGVFGGMGRGVGMGVGSAMMSDTSIGVSQMGPGSGSIGSPFAKQGGAILSHAGDSDNDGDGDDGSSRKRKRRRRGRGSATKGTATSRDSEMEATKTKTKAKAKAKTKTQKAAAANADASAPAANPATSKILSPLIPPVIKPATTTTTTTTTATETSSTSDTYSESSSPHADMPKTDDSLDPESDLFSRKSPSPAVHKDRDDNDLSKQADAKKDHIHDIHTEFNRPRKK